MIRWQSLQGISLCRSRWNGEASHKGRTCMIFNRIKGHPDAKVAIGLLASRKRVAALLDTQPENLGKMLCKSVENPIPPVDLEGDAPCQQVVHKAADPDFDLYSWFLRQRTHRMMRARISHLACATPHTRILEFTM